MNKIMNSNYRELIKFEIARARKYFDRAEEGIKMLSPDARLPVRTCYIYIYVFNQAATIPGSKWNGSRRDGME